MRIPSMVLLAALAVSCAQSPRDATPPPDPPPPGPRPESEQWGATIRLYETGRIRSVIDAAYLAVFTLPDREFTTLDTVEADFYDEEGSFGSHLTADAGEIHDQEREGRRRVKTWGGVHLVGSEGQTVRADTLWWDEARDLVYTDGPVEVTEEGDVLRGIGFESDTELTNMKIFNATGSSLRVGGWLEEEREEDRLQSAGPDTASALPDTSAVLPDTSAVLPDTSAVLPDTAAALPDTSAASRIPPP